MINFHKIILAFVEQLNGNIDVSNIAEVAHGEPINEDFNNAPWIGVYRGDIDYSPRTLGFNNFEAVLDIKVLVQASSITSAFNCEERLEDFVQKIMVATLADKTLNNNVEMLNKFNVKYGFVETERSSLYFQSAIINFEFEVYTQ